MFSSPWNGVRSRESSLKLKNIRGVLSKGRQRRRSLINRVSICRRRRTRELHGTVTQLWFHLKFKTSRDARTD